MTGSDPTGNLGERYGRDETLPEPLPGDPFGLFESWFAEAVSRRAAPNPDSMTLATVAADGSPQARIILCKQIVSDPGYINNGLMVLAPGAFLLLGILVWIQRSISSYTEEN